MRDYREHGGIRKPLCHPCLSHGLTILIISWCNMLLIRPCILVKLCSEHNTLHTAISDSQDKTVDLSAWSCNPYMERGKSQASCMLCVTRVAEEKEMLCRDHLTSFFPTTAVRSGLRSFEKSCVDSASIEIGLRMPDWGSLGRSAPPPASRSRGTPVTTADLLMSEDSEFVDAGTVDLDHWYFLASGRSSNLIPSRLARARNLRVLISQMK